MEQWEQIYQDQTVKDVEVVLKEDVKVLADSLVLKVASPVFRAMLTHEMQERTTSTINLLEYTAPEFRFFLRLLYTGKMDPADCVEGANGDSHDDRGAALPTVPPSPSSAFHTPEACPQSYAGMGRESKGYGGKGKGGPRGSQAVGSSAAAAAEGKGNSVVGEGKGSGKGPWASPPLQRVPQQPIGRVPPIQMLLAASGLSKKYQIGWLLQVLVDVVKHRLTETTFEEILAGGLKHDIAPVRLSSLEFAKTNFGVRRRYNAGQFAPELMFELQAVFPVPSVPVGEGRNIPI